MGYGTRTIDTLGAGATASADGVPEYKVGGVTIDWTTAVAASAGTVTLTDGTVVPANVQYLPYGLVLCRITASGKYGPYDAAAGDGRGDPVRGACFVLNETVFDTDLHKDNPPGVMEGGRVYLDRLKIVDAAAYTGTGAWAADIQAALPRIQVVDPDL